MYFGRKEAGRWRSAKSLRRIFFCRLLVQSHSLYVDLQAFRHFYWCYVALYLADVLDPP
jgi:hypothetical protein